MSIRCVCQNGHVLKVKESQAGKTGLCPICRGLVEVPRLPDEKLSKKPSAMSEEAIAALMGAVAPPQRPPLHGPDTPENGSQSGIGLKKICERCNREVTVGVHICPYCHTYIAKPGDF